MASKLPDFMFRRKQGCVGFVLSYSWVYKEIWIDFLFWGLVINWYKEDKDE
jgi:hypothetical protein